MIIFTKKVTENRSFTLSLEDTFFEKPHGGQIEPLSCFRVNLDDKSTKL